VTLHGRMSVFKVILLIMFAVSILPVVRGEEQADVVEITPTPGTGEGGEYYELDEEEPTPTPTLTKAEKRELERAKRREATQRRQAKFKFEKGRAAAAAGDLALARTYLESILKMPLEGEAEELDATAQRAIDMIMDRGDELLKKAREFRGKGRFLRAADILDKLVVHFRGTAVGQRAKGETESMMSRSESAKQILYGRALRYEKAGDLWRAYEQYHNTFDRFPDTHEGELSEAKIEEFKALEVVPQNLTPEMARRAQKLLVIAEIRALNLNVDLEPPSDYYRQVVEEFPNTTYAVEAAERLAEMEMDQ